MAKFISLGSGSSGNSYLLASSEGYVLIDVGIGIRLLKKYFSERGFDFSRIKAIFVTHEHADHVKSVGAVANKWNVPVYATAKVHRGMTFSYHMRTKLKSDLVRVMQVGTTVSVAGFRLTSFPVPHDSDENVGYEVNFGTHTLCLITDAGEVTDEIMNHMKRAEYLIIEANHDAEMLASGKYPFELKQRIAGGKGHLSNTAAAEALAQLNYDHLKHIWLCHLSEENNHPELARKTIEQYLRQKGIDVNKDVELTVLNRRSPSNIFDL